MSILKPKYSNLETKDIKSRYISVEKITEAQIQIIRDELHVCKREWRNYFPILVRFWK